MSLHLPQEFISSIVSTQRLDARQVQAVARTAYLAAEIDLDEDAEEQAMLDAIGELLSHVAQLPAQAIPLVSPLPIDDEERHARIVELVSDLTTRGARELAYVVAYFLAVSDVELAPVETRFLDDLQRVLGIADERAAELVATSASAATPGIGSA